MRKIKHLIALFLKFIRVKPYYSTGIHGGETCGCGKNIDEINDKEKL